MRKYLLFVVGMILASCSDQFNVENVADAVTEPSVSSDVDGLVEKARWGDGQAYVQLANCYRDGIGVKQDFIGMVAMVSLADEYGGISRMEDYLSGLPDGSAYKQVFDAMEKFSDKKYEEALAMAEDLIAKDCIEGYTVKGIITSEQGDKTEGERLLKIAAEKGSGFANLYLSVPNWHQDKGPDIATLKTLADKLPIANASLAMIYTGKENQALKDDKLAAYYYMKADEKACLTRNGARWLLAYHRNGGDLNLSDKDIERLETLADCKTEEPAVMVQNESITILVWMFTRGYAGDTKEATEGRVNG